MGNHLSPALLLPHPSNTTIYQATLRSNLLEASTVLRLLFIDPATGHQRLFFVDRDASLKGALVVFAGKIQAPIDGLQMRVHGEVVGEGSTAEELALKDRAKIEISRRIMRVIDEGLPSTISGMNDEMGADNEARVRALITERFERKCRMTRDALGIQGN